VQIKTKTVVRLRETTTGLYLLYVSYKGDKIIWTANINQARKATTINGFVKYLTRQLSSTMAKFNNNPPISWDDFKNCTFDVSELIEQPIGSTQINDDKLKLSNVMKRVEYLGAPTRVKNVLNLIDNKETFPAAIIVWKKDEWAKHIQNDARRLKIGSVIRKSRSKLKGNILNSGHALVTFLWNKDDLFMLKLKLAEEMDGYYNFTTKDYIQ
jgi:hypothetical protein